MPTRIMGPPRRGAGDAPPPTTRTRSPSAHARPGRSGRPALTRIVLTTPPLSPGALRGPSRRRRHAQARDPRPPGQGSARCAAPSRVHRRHRRPPGQAVRARGRRRDHRRGARRDRQDGGGAALQPGDRGLRGPRRGALRGRDRPGTTLVKVGVVTFPGSLDDVDARRAVTIGGNAAVALWHGDDDLKGVDAVVLPGGFSYGDYLRCGAISRFAPVMAPVVEAAGRGMPVLGICNGFQILCESHLLPGALIRNDHRKFVCRDQRLRIERTDTAWTSAYAEGAEVTIVLKNGEGGFVADEPTLDRLEGEGLVVARYLDDNPNGSLRDIAGISNERGNVVGLMPHPEHAVEDLTGPGTDGLGFFTSLVEAAFA